MKPAKLALMQTLTIGVFLLGLQACTVKVDDETPRIKKKTCEPEHTTTRLEYDLAITFFEIRKTKTDLSVLSKGSLDIYLQYSTFLVDLFDNKQLRACVVEKDGDVSVMTWDQKSLEAEKRINERLNQLVEAKEKGSNDVGDSSAKSGSVGNISSPHPMHTGLGKKAVLKKLIEEELDKAVNQGRLSVEVQSANYRGQGELTIPKEDLRVSIGKFFSGSYSKLKAEIVRVLMEGVTNFTTSQAKVYFAAEDERFRPALDYFKRVYDKDLDKVVVIEAPIKNIPHTRGANLEALGMYLDLRMVGTIPPMIRFTNPGSDFDSRLNNTTRVNGVIVINIEDQLRIFRKAIKSYFGSEMIFHLDTEGINKNSMESLHLESAMVHELTHLLNGMECLKILKETCTHEFRLQNRNDVVKRANTDLDANYKLFLGHPKTIVTKWELDALHRKYFTSSTDSERDRWVGNKLIELFNQSHKAIQHIETEVEKRAYKEQLNYLREAGLSGEEAVQAIISSGAGSDIEIYMNGTKEKISSPGIPWMESVLRELNN